VVINSSTIEIGQLASFCRGRIAFRAQTGKHPQIALFWVFWQGPRASWGSFLSLKPRSVTPQAVSL